MDRDRARQLAEAIAVGRIAIGVVALVAPTVPLRPWVGRDFAWQPRAKLLARSLGARDLALGIGVMLALRHDAPVRGWVEGAGAGRRRRHAGHAAGLREAPEERPLARPRLRRRSGRHRPVAAPAVATES